MNTRKEKAIICRVVSTTFNKKVSAWCVIPDFFFNEYWNDDELYNEVKKYIIKKTNYTLCIKENIYLEFK